VKISQALKAIYASVAAALGALGTALVDPSASLSSITAAQWVAIALAALLAGGAVYGVTNGTS
jgi:hypothetical protein